MSQQNLNPTQISYHNRLQTDFPFFARHSLFIRSKAGVMVPLVLNEAQRYIHAKLEAQINATGKVRALLLKGRQQGASTYISGRFYWKTTRNPGKATFILSHEADTTEKLFQMIERYHANCPGPVKAETDVANRRRMVFKNITSEYFVGTAGNENVGRGGTVQYLHASEAAFYPDGDGFSKGLLQSVPDMSGTEVIIESTANGMDPLFYPMCMNALAGKGEYILIFVPWFWQTEYQKTPPLDFEATPQEAELQIIYGLSDAQIYWRRIKIIELKGETSFMQEYPNNVEEAFTVSGSSLIPSIAVMDARRNITLKDPDAPLVMGVDPNEAGGRATIAFRQGRVMLDHHEFEGRKPMDFVGIVAKMIDERRPDKCFIDTGNGYGIVDRLYELGYGDIVMGIGFGDGALEERVYLNKRTEMWCLMRDWFKNRGVRCPDSDQLHKEFTCVPDSKKTSSGLTKLESKEKIIADTGVKPDLADAYALTFAMPVRRQTLEHQRKWTRSEKSKTAGLKTIRRRESLDSSGTIVSSRR